MLTPLPIADVPKNLEASVRFPGPAVDGLQPRMPLHEEAAARRPPRLQGLKVLVVDDDQDTCEIIEAILERAGAEVRTCLSASQALTATDIWVPDVLVSDIGMPGEDGYTFIRKIRARRTEEGGRMVAVALTASRATRTG